jgi:hypothetical protein
LRKNIQLSSRPADYGVSLGDGEKDTVVRGLWHKNCGLFVEARREKLTIVERQLQLRVNILILAQTYNKRTAATKLSEKPGPAILHREAHIRLALRP